MFKYLIKDTTREEREQIVIESLEFSDVVCGSGSMYDMYLPYINGEKELSEINAEYQARYAVNMDDHKRNGCF